MADSSSQACKRRGGMWSAFLKMFVVLKVSLKLRSCHGSEPSSPLADDLELRSLLKIRQPSRQA